MWEEQGEKYWRVHSPKTHLNLDRGTLARTSENTFNLSCYCHVLCSSVLLQICPYLTHSTLQAFLQGSSCPITPCRWPQWGLVSIIKWPLPWGERKITTHTNSPTVSAGEPSNWQHREYALPISTIAVLAGWTGGRHLVRLPALPTNQRFSEDSTESTLHCRVCVTAALENRWRATANNTQLKALYSPRLTP